VSIPELFDHARRGRIDTVFFGAVEVDAHGRTNTSAAGSLAKPTAKFPGVVGACSLRRWCKKPVLVVPRQSRRNLVPRVAVTSTADDARRTPLLTELARFSVGDGGATLEAADDVLAVRERTGFSYAGEHPAPLGEPPPHALAAIAALDPDHLRAALVGA
jgi:glutaconate CoA-transferase subunit B